MAKITYISVCSGIEAASVAWSPLGWSALAFAEIEPFPCAVLAHHWPTVPNLGDLTKWREWPAELLAQADVLIGGTPCQSFSVAGLRGGLDDARGNLSLEFVRLANAIDDLRRAAGRKPAYILWENVPGVLSDSTNGFGAMLGGLAGSAAAIAHPSGASWSNAGVVAGPARAVGWRVLGAEWYGLAQRRNRVFVLARGGAGDWSGPDALLPIGESVRGDRPQGRAQRQDITGCLSPGAHPGGANGQDAYTNQLVVDKLAKSLTTGTTGSDIETTTLVLAPQLAKPLGAHASQRNDLDNDTYVVTAFDLNQVTNQSNPQPGDPCHTLPATAAAPIICFGAQMSTPPYQTDIADTLQAKNPKAVLTHALRGEGFDASEDGTGRGTPLVVQSGIRRLTVTEVEKLQGFPPGHTQVPYRGKSAPDSPRYKAVGNSMATPCIRWIGLQIVRVEADHAQ